METTHFYCLNLQYVSLTEFPISDQPLFICVFWYLYNVLNVLQFEFVDLNVMPSYLIIFFCISTIVIMTLSIDMVRLFNAINFSYWAQQTSLIKKTEWESIYQKIYFPEICQVFNICWTFFLSNYRGLCQFHGEAELASAESVCAINGMQPIIQQYLPSSFYSSCFAYLHHLISILIDQTAIKKPPVSNTKYLEPALDHN